jgi:hypothetical protein
VKAHIFGADEILEARKVQQMAKRLHLPPVPVVTWEAEIFDRDGKLSKKLIGKSHSYTRNGMNLIAIHGGYLSPVSGISSGSFGDGLISLKNPAGTILTGTGTNSFYFAVNSTGVGAIYDDTYSSLIVGYGNTAESMDDYTLVSEFGTGSAINQLVKGFTGKACAWATTPRKFVTDIYRLFTNSYSAAQEIKEMGYKLYLDKTTARACELFLVMRDVLASPISLPAGSSILMHYKIETLF